MIYELIYEDLTHLGGPMGTEYTTEHSLGLFDDVDKAKKAAEKNYGGKLEWFEGEENDCEEGQIRTDDLRYVMYHIITREVIS